MSDFQDWDDIYATGYRVQPKIVLLLTLGILASASATAVDHDVEFDNFMQEYGKVYADPLEQERRSHVFRENLAKIKEHNNKNLSYTMGVNVFADLTQNEWKARLGFLPPDPVATNLMQIKYDTAPPEMDWRSKGVVTPIKNQFQCGACWAFSATASIESAWAIKNGSLFSLSEQQLVDCSKPEGNEGCNGGAMDWAFNYTILNGGLALEESYRYTAHDFGICWCLEDPSSCKLAPPRISSWKDIVVGDEGAVEAVVGTIGPVSIGVEADQDGFRFYKSGVFSGACGEKLDHGVALVGYGSDLTSKSPYWILRNSWGSAWGEEGYMRLERGINLCGLANAASYPIV